MSSSDLTRNWLINVLRPYVARDRIVPEVMDILGARRTLAVKTDAFTFDSGHTALLLLLHGTLPINYRGATYQIPVQIWVPLEYPRVAPLAFVVPTKEMGVRKSREVDPGGRVREEVVEQWWNSWENKSIEQLLKQLTSIFSAAPPVYARPPEQAAASGSRQDGRASPVQAAAVNGSMGSPTRSGPPPPPARPYGPPGVGVGIGASQESLPQYRPAPATPPNPYAQHATPPRQASGTYPFQPQQPRSPPPPTGSPPMPQRPGYPQYGSQPASPVGPAIPSRPFSGPPPIPAGPGSGYQPPTPPQPQFQPPPQPQMPPGQEWQPPQPGPTAYAQGGAYPPQAISPPPSQYGQYQQVPQQPQSQQQQPYYPPQQQQPQGPPPIPQNHPPSSHPAQPPQAQPPPAAQPPALQRPVPPPDLLSSPEQSNATLPTLRRTESGGPPPIPPSKPPPPSQLHLHSILLPHLNASLPPLLQSLASNRAHLLERREDLESGEPAIRDEMARLEAVRSVCNAVGKKMEEAVKRGDERVVDLEGRGDISVDEVVCGISIVHNQLIDLVAEDNAIEDTIYHMTRALDTERLDLDRFLKSIRTLAREQYMKRALIERILQGMGQTQGW